MNICIDGRGAVWYRGTGIGTYTFELLKYLYLDTQNQYFILLPAEDVSEEVLAVTNPYVIHRIVSPKHSTEEEAEIISYLEKIQADLFHVPQNGIGLPQKKVCRYVATIHDIIPLRMPNTTSKSYSDLFASEIPGILKRADVVITVSQFSKKDICAYFNLDPNKIEVTHLAAEEMYYELSKEEAKQKMQEKYGIQDDYILYVGGYGKRKNITTIVKAFYQYKKQKKTDLKFVIAGEVNYKADEVISLVSELDLCEEVLLIGKVKTEDMVHLYNASLILVYVSFYEGFGLPPLEAAKCGIPIITSNTTSIPEIVGKGAIQVDPNLDEELYQALLKLLEDPKEYKKMCEKAKNLAKRYDWKKTILETIQIFSHIFQNFT